MEHIIALVCYANITALRRVFKLHGWYLRKYKSESREILLHRHRLESVIIRISTLLWYCIKY